MNDSEICAQLEGLLFAVGKPLSRRELLKMLEVDDATLERAIKIASAAHERGITVVDDGVQVELRVAAQASAAVERARAGENARDIGRAGLEVLAAVLYRGPLSRAGVDFIRGVNSSQTLRTLTMRGLVRRTQNPKDDRSFLYEPTTELLAAMGATHVRDLPDFDAVKDKLLALEEAYRNVQSEPA